MPNWVLGWTVPWSPSTRTLTMKRMEGIIELESSKMFVKEFDWLDATYLAGRFTAANIADQLRIHILFQIYAAYAKALVLFVILCSEPSTWSSTHKRHKESNKEYIKAKYTEKMSYLFIWSNTKIHTLTRIIPNENTTVGESSYDSLVRDIPGCRILWLWGKIFPSLVTSCSWSVPLSALLYKWRNMNSAHYTMSRLQTRSSLTSCNITSFCMDLVTQFTTWCWLYLEPDLVLYSQPLAELLLLLYPFFLCWREREGVHCG